MDRNIFVDWFNEGSLSIPFRLLKDYKNIGLNEDEVMLLLHVYSFIEKGNSFPTPELLAKRMTYSDQECSQILRSLVKRGYLLLQEGEDENKRFLEAYSISPLWNKLIIYAGEEKQTEKIKVEKQTEINVYQMFEEEFGRPLSPIECELLAMWLDQDKHDPSLIKQALMEAVVSGKRNLRYIDRILIEWSKNNVKTVEQAKEYGKKFRKHQYSNNSAAPKTNQPIKRPTYDWLENN